MGFGELTGQETPAGGDAGGAGRIGAGKPDAVVGDGIHAGGQQYRVSGNPETIRPLLVGHDQQNIRFFVFGHDRPQIMREFP
jgi:hypothetical protein